MKFWGWIIRIVTVGLGIGVFLLQSQPVKKSLLEFIINQPFEGTSLKVEAGVVRGFFPLQFTVASLDLKKEGEHLANLTNIMARWHLSALLKGEIQFHIIKAAEIKGDIYYKIHKHAFFAHLNGQGIPLGGGKYKGALTAIDIALPKLDLMKGQVGLTFFDGQSSMGLTFQIEEISEKILNIRNIKLIGREIQGNGTALVYPKEGTWEGQGEVALSNLALYDRWVQNSLEGSLLLKGQKNKQGFLILEGSFDKIRYGALKANLVKVQSSIQGIDHFNLSLRGQECSLSGIPLTTLSAAGGLTKGRGSFDITGQGQHNISLKIQGTIELLSSKGPETHLTVKQVDLRHPLHQLHLPQPAQIIYRQGELSLSKILLTLGGGSVLFQDVKIENDLSGHVKIDQVPLSILRIIHPDWKVSGHLSGKGTLQGTKENPDINLSLEGKDLQWGVPKKFRHVFPGVHLNSLFNLTQNFFKWHIKVVNKPLMNMICEGKISGRLTQESPIEASLKGHGDIGIISTFMTREDLIQGRASCDLVATGTVGNPQINGQVSITKGLYENSTFGTLIKNIDVQGKAVGNVLTLSRFTGQDGAKGRVNGQGSLKFISLLHPEVDLRLALDQLIVVQNDALSGKASGFLKLSGPLGTDQGAQITGDIVLKPFVVRLEEQSEKIVSIKLLEKKPDGSFGTLAEHAEKEQVAQKPSLFPLDIKLSSPQDIYVQGYGFDAQWKGELKAQGVLMDPHLKGDLILVQGKFDLLGKHFKVTKGHVRYSFDFPNDPYLEIFANRDIGDILAIMQIEGHASNPKIMFSSNPPLPQEEVLARVLFGKGLESISGMQSLLLANALTSFKSRSGLSFTDKIRSAFGLDVLEFKERKSQEHDDFQPSTQVVSVGKRISEKFSLSLDQSVSGEGGTTATLQYDFTPTLKIEADVGGEKNSAFGFSWIKKY